MSRPKVVLTTLASVLGLALACSRQPAGPMSPTAHPVASAADGADGSTLKADPPELVSPIKDQQAPDNPLLIAKPTKMDFDGRSDGLLYHFEVYNPAGSKILDSGLLAQPQFQITDRLDYSLRFTWRV